MVTSIAIKQSKFSHLFSLFDFINKRALSETTTPDQSGPGSNGNEGVLRIPQISKARASASDVLISYPGHLLGGEV